MRLLVMPPESGVEKLVLSSAHILHLMFSVTVYLP
jgi:hypothetical protein